MIDKLEFRIKQNVYKVEDIRIQNLIDFEKMKAMISGGMYGSIFRMGTTTGDEALTMIDMESFFAAFCPKVLKDLECSDFKMLGIKDYQEIKKVYAEEIIPWYNQVVSAMNPPKKEKE
jgi:hypothetical protein